MIVLNIDNDVVSIAAAERTIRKATAIYVKLFVIMYYLSITIIHILL